MTHLFKDIPSLSIPAWQNFPLPGSYHFRFKKKLGESKVVWLDMVDDSAEVPAFDGVILAKVTRISMDVPKPTAAGNNGPAWAGHASAPSASKAPDMASPSPSVRPPSHIPFPPLRSQSPSDSLPYPARIHPPHLPFALFTWLDDENQVASEDSTTADLLNMGATSPSHRVSPANVRGPGPPPQQRPGVVPAPDIDPFGLFADAAPVRKAIRATERGSRILEHNLIGTSRHHLQTTKTARSVFTISDHGVIYPHFFIFSHASPRAFTLILSLPQVQKSPAHAGPGPSVPSGPDLLNFGSFTGAPVPPQMGMQGRLKNKRDSWKQEGRFMWAGSVAQKREPSIIIF